MIILEEGAGTEIVCRMVCTLETSSCTIAALYRQLAVDLTWAAARAMDCCAMDAAIIERTLFSRMLEALALNDD